MSWLFGIKKQNPQIPGDFDPNQPGDGQQQQPQQQLTSSERKAMEAYRFDSSALERAAEAARTLEKSSKCQCVTPIKRGAMHSNSHIHYLKCELLN